MRILQVCNKPPFPSRDGGSVAMYNMALSLSKAGHEVSILTMVTDKHRLLDEEKFLFDDFAALQTVYVNTSIRIWDMLVNLFCSGKPYNAVRFISDAFESKLKKMVQVNDYDVVQLEGLYLTPYIPVIRRYSGALVALRTHNTEFEIWKQLSKTEVNPFRRFYLSTLARRIRLFEEAAVNQYDLLVPITQHDKEQYRWMGNTQPALVVPAGFDDTFEEQDQPTPDVERSEMPSLYFMGSLDWIPNQEGLLWFVNLVMPPLKKKFPGLQLHVAGRNAPPGFIRKINRPGITYHGETKTPLEFIQSHDILVTPCFSGSGMRIKVVEAMAMGKPVVTTPLGAQGLDVLHEYNMIIAVTPEEYRFQLEKLILEPDYCKKIGRHARDFVIKNLNNAVLANRLTEFYTMHLK